MPPPVVTMTSNGGTQLVKPLTYRTRDMGPADQIVIYDSDGNGQPFELYRGMRAEQLLARVATAGIIDFDRAELRADDANWDEFAALVRAAWPNKCLSEIARTEPGVYKAEGRITCRFTSRYYRAIAKIAFHYFLVHSRRGMRGDESVFTSIRRFIIQGGDPAPFFEVSEPRFANPFRQLPSGRTLTPSRWCHILAACEARTEVVGYVHLFAGPGCLRRPHHIRLAKLDRRIALPDPVFGHVYEYDEDQPAVGCAGRVFPTRLIRAR